jgi:thiamine-phosphate pyrophosphorylase
MSQAPGAQWRIAPRLYLGTPPMAEPAELQAAVTDALAAAHVAAVLLRLAPADERTLINRIKAIAPAVQSRGAALVIDGLPDLVVRAGADGAHVTGIEPLRAAVSRLKPDRIVGAGGLASRHDAMTAGEAGADYVMFGEPDAAGRRPSFTAVTERVAWWAELFEIPCVGWAERIEEVEELCTAGADFIAVEAAVFADPRGAATAIADIASRLSLRGPA